MLLTINQIAVTHVVVVTMNGMCEGVDVAVDVAVWAVTDSEGSCFTPGLDGLSCDPVVSW